MHLSMSPAGQGIGAAEEGVGAVGGARVALGEILGFAGFILEPFEIMATYFGSFEEAKDAIKSESYL